MGNKRDSNAEPPGQQGRVPALGPPERERKCGALFKVIAMTAIIVIVAVSHNILAYCFLMAAPFLISQVAAPTDTRRISLLVGIRQDVQNVYRDRGHGGRPRFNEFLENVDRRCLRRAWR